MTSVSYLLQYAPRQTCGDDRVGGLPSHLPAQWPRCQLCQQRMGFVGQIYAKDWFPLTGNFALQVYVCNDHRKTIKYPGSRKSFEIAESLHLQLLPAGARENSRKEGLRCLAQPKLHISYQQVADSVDQWTFLRRKLTEQDLADKHLRSDKLGGMFPYDGYDSPKITKQNRLIAQFAWQGIGGTTYLYESEREGIYAVRRW
jgi:hypothetical protein